MTKTNLSISILFIFLFVLAGKSFVQDSSAAKPRVIVTSDGEIDDECSLVRFLLYSNEWEVEAIITSSSQYHWHGHRWAGDDWSDPYLEAYAIPTLFCTKRDIRHQNTLNQ